MSNIDEYLAFRFKKTKLLHQMENYIKYRKYNSDFGDLVPMILAKYLTVTVRAFDTDSIDMAREHAVNPAASNLSITIQRRGDHFNGIILSNNMTPSQPQCQFCIPPALSQCTMKQGNQLKQCMNMLHYHILGAWIYYHLPPHY